MLYIVIIVGVLAISYLAYKNWLGRGGEKYLISVIRRQNKDLEAAVEEIQALEQGRDDQDENYEQQFLTFNERLEENATTIADLKKDLAEANAHLEKHDRECLPILKETRWFALAATVETA